ncbi:MAG: type I glyceraldehyde-3-phosphate dehydrogenase [Candidatus Eisenbacteria bacterium]|uniref:Type I glyceraldehyde-3-phosphate dehydrogenase n=1 Tax=Eiseniibacteriota bacterium TaxID=2212470 RepID=A0A9D6QKP0_UNCEI|nr:type I glyceraldehyde-3-phosphate dehydrogenase [Candidatus Eisenbacteria bacterium]MBI3540470.1 type I glyceraldehyde-3-phosphate dehydrogenase [Candidatus Eisenbacteria bacterium]
MALRVGINGFGRIGRQVVRAAIERSAPLEFVAVNDVTDAASLAHLLRYDSVHGTWADASSRPVDGKLAVAGRTIQVLAEKDPARLPWKALGVEAVLEATGKFTDRAGGALHLDAGARNVLISAPAKGVDLTFVFGVNEGAFDAKKHTVVSIGSCTTNGLAPVAKAIHDGFGIEHGTMTTIHAYTNDQRILDLPHKDLRRARAAAINLIPTSTGAAKAIGEVLPELKGRLDGIAVRAPVADGSLIDLVCRVKKPVTRETINAAVKAAAEGPMRGVLEYCEDPIVSSDVIGNPHSSVFDALSTLVLDGALVKVLAWYDNEWGFSNRVVDALVRMA